MASDEPEAPRPGAKPSRLTRGLIAEVAVIALALIDVCDWQPTSRRIEQTDAVIEVIRRKACDWPIPGLQDERTKRYDPASMPWRASVLSESAGKSSRSAEFAVDSAKPRLD